MFYLELLSFVIYYYFLLLFITVIIIIIYVSYNNLYLSDNWEII